MKMKELSLGTASVTKDTANDNIINFKISNTKPNDAILVENNKVSTTTSSIPIYMWFDDNTIWLWSEENWIEVNTDASNMFSNLQAVTNIELPYNIDTSKVENMENLFHNCLALTELDISNFDTANVTNMKGIFSGSDTNLGRGWDYRMNLTNIKGLNSLNTSQVNDMSKMFYMCVSLPSLDVSNFDTSNVRDMSFMFGGIWSDEAYYMALEEIKGIQNFNTKNVENMKGMFYCCSNLTTLNISNFNTSNVTDMSYMFIQCRNLSEIELSKFDTKKVINMDLMFRDCVNITELDLSDWDTTSLLSTAYMFYYCPNLTTIYATDKFVTDQITNSTQMFESCQSIIGGNGTTYQSIIKDKTYAHIDGGQSNPGYFTRKE